jgi:hypothetical protein
MNQEVLFALFFAHHLSPIDRVALVVGKGHPVKDVLL